MSIQQLDKRTTVIAKETVLPHPPEDVFAAVMSPEIAPQIDPAVKQWDPDRRPIGVGTEFAIRGRFQWLPIRGRSQVTVWERPARAVFESLQPTWPVRLTATHSFQEASPGSTRYTWSMTAQHGAVGRVVTRLMGRLMERTLEDQARTLAAWLDANPGAASFARL